MSDTRRNSDPDAYWWAVKFHNAQYWVEYDLKARQRWSKYPWYKPPKEEKIKAKHARMLRDEALIRKGADGKQAKGRSVYRFGSARVDGSGKLNTFDDIGAGRRSRWAKRKTSKDTRRFGKRNIKRELDDV